MLPWADDSLDSERHLDRLSAIRKHGRDQHTETQTTEPQDMRGKSPRAAIPTENKQLER